MILTVVSSPARYVGGKRALISWGIDLTALMKGISPSMANLRRLKLVIVSYYFNLSDVPVDIPNTDGKSQKKCR